MIQTQQEIWEKVMTNGMTCSSISAMIMADWKQEMLTKKKDVEDIVQDGIQFIAQFLPKATYLCFPLLSAAAVWAIKRGRSWKEKILSWNVWADPSAVIFSLKCSAIWKNTGNVLMRRSWPKSWDFRLKKFSEITIFRLCFVMRG
jgi:hypothetical protein